MDSVFEVTNSFAITGRGCVVSGRIKSGIFHTGDPVLVVRAGAAIFATTITKIEMIKYSSPQRSDVSGFFLAGIHKEDVLPGDIIVNRG